MPLRPPGPPDVATHRVLVHAEPPGKLADVLPAQNPVTDARNHGSRGPQARDPRWRHRVEAIVETAYAELVWVDETFSLWKPDSPLFRTMLESL